jgi:hypothetical protein
MGIGFALARLLCAATCSECAQKLKFESCCRAVLQPQVEYQKCRPFLRFLPFKHPFVSCLLPRWLWLASGLRQLQHSPMRKRSHYLR